MITMNTSALAKLRSANISRSHSGCFAVIVWTTNIQNAAIEAPASPLPQVSGFPLADAPARPWPRSPLATDDSQLEAYLVGHNTLMAEDGVAGFMPYVDVVVQDGAVAAADVDTPAADDGR